MSRKPNSGHGHVYPRPDGVKARCGGPGICSECSRDAADAQRTKLAQDLSAKLTDQGKLIEGGFQLMRLTIIPPEASATQVAEMRKAFFLGADHLFASIMSVLDDDREPTPKDMARMDLILRELQAFRIEVSSNQPPGRA